MYLTTETYLQHPILHFKIICMKLIDRTPSTVGHALAELEAVGLVKRRWISRCPTQPYHTYVKLPAGEDAP